MLLKKLMVLADELIPLDDKSKRRDMLQKSLHDRYHNIFVAESDNGLVGFVEVRVFPDFVEGSCIAIIQNLVVKEEFRNLGIKSINTTANIRKIQRAR